MAKMLKLIMKNIFSSPATRTYPINPREPFERTRNKIHFDDTDCIYCGICQRKCPADAINVIRAEKTWELNAYRCIICGECVNVCPKKSITMLNKRRSVAENRKYITIKKEEVKSEEI